MINCTLVAFYVEHYYKFGLIKYAFDTNVELI